jgi:hypothetical protein
VNAATRGAAWRALAAVGIGLVIYTLARVVADATKSEIPPGLPLDAAAVLLIGAAMTAIVAMRLLRP